MVERGFLKAGHDSLHWCQDNGFHLPAFQGVSTLHLRGVSRLCPEVCPNEKQCGGREEKRRKEERKEGGKERQKSISKYLNPVFKCRQRILFPLFAPQKLPTEGSRFSGLANKSHLDSTLALTAICKLHRRAAWLPLRQTGYGWQIFQS